MEGLLVRVITPLFGVRYPFQRRNGTFEGRIRNVRITDTTGVYDWAASLDRLELPHGLRPTDAWRGH